jgi:hypothetical protein
MSANGIDGGEKGKEDDVISINSFSSISNPGIWRDPVFTDEEEEEDSDDEDDEELYHPVTKLPIPMKMRRWQRLHRDSSGDDKYSTSTSDDDYGDDDDDDDDDDMDTSDDDDDANALDNNDEEICVVNEGSNETAIAATVSLQRTMTDFFQPVVQNKSAIGRGRRAKKRRAIKAARDTEEEEVCVRNKAQRRLRKGLGPTVAAIATKAAKERISLSSTESVVTKSTAVAKQANHSLNDNMKIAVEEWDAWDVVAQGKKPSKAGFARKKGLIPDTFKKYAHDVPSKRRKLGASVGRTSLVPEDKSQFFMELTVRADRANAGFTPAQIKANFMKVIPTLTQEQASNHYHHTFIPKHSDRLKPRPVKAQKTTSKRSQCTVAQQFRWFTLYSKALAFLREKNTGVCRVTGKSFGEVIEYFILGGDETNLIADADGELRIVGEKGKKKHEKKVSDYRGSITMYRTGTAAGNNGPTTFVMKGKRRKKGYNARFLIQEGCAVGSSFSMTENAYMTEEAWQEMSPNLVMGYRNLPVVRDNPQWWMVEIVDGFGAHLTNLDALTQRADAKILLLKEEADSSSYNQAYDKHAAKSDKRQQRNALTILRSMKGRSKNIIDQWDLVLCGTQAVRYSDHHPEVWIESFKSVNLHPKFQIPFPEWCKKLEQFMMAADSFDLFTQSEDVDEYTLLPTFWQAMPAEEKKAVVAIVHRFKDKMWGAECCRELMTAMNCNLSDLPSLQPCIFLAMDDPSHLDRGLEEVATTMIQAGQTTIDAVEANRKKAIDGLKVMSFKSSLKGIDRFNHLVRYRQIKFAKNEKDHKISDALACSPRTNHQRDLMCVDYPLKMQGELWDDITGGVTLEKAAQVRLDNIGMVKSHGCFLNDPLRLERLQSRLELQRSIGRRDEIQRLTAEGKELAEKNKLSPLLLDAIKMFKAKETNKKGFTKDCIKSILLSVFGIAPPSSGKLSTKPAWMALLERLDADTPGKIDEQLAVCVASTSNLDDAADMESQNVLWLYDECNRQRIKMNYNQSTLDLSLIVLRALNKIEIDIPESTDEDDDENRSSEYAAVFFEAFQGLQRDISFMYELAGRTRMMILDKHLTEEALAEYGSK